MTNKPENPPAFPKLKRLKSESITGYGFTAECTDSMTLRDYFAGQALAGMMANIDLMAAIGRVTEGSGNLDAAKHCYAMADAMLKARAA